MLNPLILQGASAILGGLFGNKQKLSPEQQFQTGIAKDLGKYGRSAPLSDPGEQMALAQQNALLGEQQRQQRGSLYSQLPTNVTGAPADFAMGLGAQEVSQRSALNAQALLDAMQQRRQALIQAAGVMQGVGPRQQQEGIGNMFGQAAQAYSAYHTAKQGRQDYQQYLDMFRNRPATTQGGVGPQLRPPTMELPGIGNYGGQGGPLKSAMSAAFNPQLGMSGGNQGQNVPGQLPIGAGAGIPSANSKPTKNNLGLQSSYNPNNEWMFPQLLQSGVR